MTSQCANSFTKSYCVNHASKNTQFFAPHRPIKIPPNPKTTTPTTLTIIIPSVFHPTAAPPAAPELCPEIVVPTFEFVVGVLVSPPPALVLLAVVMLDKLVRLLNALLLLIPLPVPEQPLALEPCCVERG